MKTKDAVAEIAKRMSEAHRIESEINDLSKEANEIESRRETWEDYPEAIEHRRLAEICGRLDELKTERDEHLLAVDGLAKLKK